MLYYFCISCFLKGSIGKHNGIRLVNGFIKNEGLVELQVSETVDGRKLGLQWVPVCVSKPASPAVGTVACRQLGYEGFANFYEASYFGSSRGLGAAINVTSCSGNEGSLLSCIRQSSCSPENMLAVLCASKSGWLIYVRIFSNIQSILF